jgi:hypothetical protein
LSAAPVESHDGQTLVQHFNSFHQGVLPAQTGIAAFLYVMWTASPSPDPRCQIQLAVHTPADWRTFDWASNHPVTNGTINAWGHLLDHHPELGDHRTTITIASVAVGEVVVVWLLGRESLSDRRLIRAHVVYACGDTDYRSAMYPVEIS